MRSFFTVLVLALTCGAAVACGAGGRPVRPGNETVTIVEVDNQNFTDMTIYLVNGGQRIRLGRATGKSKATLRLPRGTLTFPRELQFMAEPAGMRGTTTTTRIWVTPGDRVTLMITP